MYKWSIIAAIIVAAVLLQVSGILEPGKIIAIARQYTDQWWLPVVLVLMQVALFTFALAGTVFLWVAAALFPPIPATLILALGATLGGVSAYYFSATLSDEWVQRVERSHIYRTLHKQDSFFALLAMRIMPAFPHGLVNYSSGFLNVNLVYFVLATFIGIGLKSYIYAPIIYQAAGGASLKDLINFSTIGPLILLSVVMFIGVLAKYKWELSHGIPTE